MAYVGDMNFANGWGMNPLSVQGPLQGMSVDGTGGPGFRAAGSGMPSSIGGQGNFGGLGANLDTLQLGLNGIGTIGNLWAAFQQQKLAKAQFKYTKNVTDTNLANQISSYNTALEDRARTRGNVQGQSAEEVNNYITGHKLTRAG